MATDLMGMRAPPGMDTIDFSKPIPARHLSMDGTNVDREGFDRCCENRKKNVEMGLPSWKRDREIKTEPIAIVGYGPSLNKTWERIRDFKHVWSTSKSHDFLISKGIMPERHFDLDPRAYKAEFITNPQPTIQYCLSTHIHPSYIRKLLHHHCKVCLYHVDIDPTKKFDPNLRLDPRYQHMKARFDVGVQCAEAAFRDGYREQHWFGIEYGHEAGNTHAGEHWGVSGKQQRFQIDVDGRFFETNAMFFHGLMLAEHFFCDRALVKPTIHGDGLLGHFIKCRGRVPRLKVRI